jgi:hypothetical protein
MALFLDCRLFGGNSASSSSPQPTLSGYLPQSKSQKVPLTLQSISPKSLRWIYMRKPMIFLKFQELTWRSQEVSSAEVARSP